MLASAKWIRCRFLEGWSRGGWTLTWKTSRESLCVVDLLNRKYLTRDVGKFVKKFNLNYVVQEILWNLILCSHSCYFFKKKLFKKGMNFSLSLGWAHLQTEQNTDRIKVLIELLSSSKPTFLTHSKVFCRKINLNSWTLEIININSITSSSPC